MFFVHGGGWRSGSRQTFHLIMDELCRRGYICATTDYRLNAKNAFEQLSDIREAFDTFAGILKERGGRMPEIAVYGESAGAHLGSLFALAAPGELGEDVSRLKYPEIRPAKVILQSTPCDFLHFEGMMPQTWAAMQNIAGVPYEQDPARYERLSLKNLIRPDNPEIFFIEAEYEHLFDSRFTRRLAVEHRKMGIDSQWKIYERVEHGFFYELTRKMQKAALEDICLFLEGQLHTEF